MLSFFGRLSAFVAGVAYLVFGYGMFNAAPFVSLVHDFFAQSVLSAGVIIIGAVCGYIATNFFWQQQGLPAKVVSLFALLPLAIGVLAAVSEDVGTALEHGTLLMVVRGVFLASGIVLSVCAFFIGTSANKPEPEAEH